MTDHDIIESVERASRSLSELVGAAVEGGARVVVTRAGKEVAAIVSVETLARLERLEDELDIVEATEARRDPETVPWHEVKDDLRLLDELEARLGPEVARAEFENQRARRSGTTQRER